MPEPIRILIIDDNPDDRALEIRELQRSLPDVAITAITGPDQLAQTIATERFDVVITDFQLGWATGMDVLRQVKAHAPDLPVIMFTSTATQEQAIAAMKAGLDDYVIKSPTHFVRLPVAVEAALNHVAAKRAAQAGIAAREEFLTIAAHELRTPLTTITVSLQLIATRLSQITEGISDAARARLAPLDAVVRRARGQARRIDRLVEDISAAVRMQRDGLATRPQALDLVAVAREAVADCQLAWPDRPLTIEGLPTLQVNADPDRLYEVITQLLSNACKFSAPALPVTVAISRDVDQARLAVRDKGPGIPPAEHERLWDRFYRLPDLGHQSGSSVGLGLGLTISRALMTAMGGAMGVESAPGEGATFWFTLPLAAEQE